MNFFSLASSSKGNCTYISSNNRGILIDAGVTTKELINFLSLGGMEKDKIEGIFITHEHYDHIKGLKNISNLLRIPIYGSYGTLSELLKKGCIANNIKLCEINEKPAKLDNFEVVAFHTPHDSAESLGFSVTDGTKRASVCTDLGYVPAGGFKELEETDIILLESNYDENMLLNSKYPTNLKKRIMSNSGHLSNDACSRYMERLIKKGVKNFLLGHLSQNNNVPQLAMQTVISNLDIKGIKFGDDYKVDVAPVKTHGKVLKV